MNGQIDMNNNNGQQPVSGCAIASLVLGIVALLTSCCFYYISIPLAVIGIILGIVGIKSQKRGKGMGIAGLVCSLVSIAPAVFIIVTGSAILGSDALSSLQ